MSENEHLLKHWLAQASKILYLYIALPLKPILIHFVIQCPINYLKGEPTESFGERWGRGTGMNLLLFAWTWALGGHFCLTQPLQCLLCSIEEMKTP